MPTFAVLPDAECRRVLRRNHVGRLAYMKGRGVDIEPLGYVMSGRWLFARSAPGSKFAALEHRPYAAFEVDEVDGPFDWRSVVVHGTIAVFPEDGSALERRQYARAVRALRRVMPRAFKTDDPVPERGIVYGIYIHQLDGRAARSARRVQRRSRHAR